MSSSGIDFLAFTGHKDLYGLPGSGGLCCETAKKIRPLIQGGTGIHGENYINPDIFPEGFEAGTLNMPAIWALKAGVDYVSAHSDEIRKKEDKLVEYLFRGLKQLKGINVYDTDVKRVATCCFTVNGFSSDKVIALLDKNGICARGGIHCSILAHETIGTVQTGSVRISLNYMNSISEIDQLLDILGRR